MTNEPPANPPRLPDGLTQLLDTMEQRLAHTAGRQPPALADIPRQVSADDDLVERFRAAATSAGLIVHRPATGEWTTHVVTALREAGATNVLLAEEQGSALSGQAVAEIATVLDAAGLRVVRDLSDDTLFTVDAALTGVAAAVAETGSIVCTSGPGLARGSSLIPPLHVALVRTSQLVPDLCDAFAKLSESDLPANANIISGPSKTADIEGILVTGVHGPGVVHIVLID